MVIMKQVQANLLAIQSLLGIRDWKITPHIVSQTELKTLLKDNNEKSLVFGAIFIHPEFRTADLYVWEDVDTNEYSFGLKYVLVHECLHIILYPYTELYNFLTAGMNEMVSYVLDWEHTNHEEKIINQLTSSFIRLLSLIQKHTSSK